MVAGEAAWWNICTGAVLLGEEQQATQAARDCHTMHGRRVQAAAGSSMDRVGHMRVRKLLQQRTFPASFQGAPLVAQFSSLGSLTKPWLSELGASFSAGRSSAGLGCVWRS